jgi:hypothetical protein
MYNDFGKAFIAGAIIGLVAIVAVLALAIVAARRSLRWSRPGASFGALAYPVSLPLLGILIALRVAGESRSAMLISVGLCTLAAAAILGRAIWLRPGADLSSAPVRQRRRREIALCAAGALLLYGLFALARFQHG